MFIKSTGSITEVNQEDDQIILLVENSATSLQTYFSITKDTLLFDCGTTEEFSMEALKPGLTIDAYYNKSQPMIMIYPARIIPEILIVTNPQRMGQVKVGGFDESLVSLDKELKLNIGEATLLINNKGEKINKANLKGRGLIVFYIVSTKSIPAQATPSKVIAL